MHTQSYYLDALHERAASDPDHAEAIAAAIRSLEHLESSSDPGRWPSTSTHRYAYPRGEA